MLFVKKLKIITKILNTHQNGSFLVVHQHIMDCQKFQIFLDQEQQRLRDEQQRLDLLKNLAPSCPVVQAGKVPDAGPVTITKQAGNVSIMPVIPATMPLPQPSPPLIGQHIRIQRYQPAKNGEMYLNVSEIMVYTPDGKMVPIVSGYVNPQMGGYGWQNLIDKNPDTFAHTESHPAGMLGVRLAGNTEIGFIAVANRRDCCVDRILGSELQLLDANENVVRRWKFSDADSTRGWPLYRVSRANGFVLEKGDR